MKKYTVYYVIKRDGHGWLRHHDVMAKNQKEAFRLTKEHVYNTIKRNAFWCTCKIPVELDDGTLEWDWRNFPRYYAPWKQLW